MLYQIQQLWRHLSKRRKVQLVALGALMIVVSFAEVMSLAAVLPFLSVLTAPDQIYVHSIMSPMVALFQGGNPRNLLLPITFAFAGTAILAGVARISLLWAQTRISASIGADFSIQAYELTLYQPYAIHVSRNSSEILAGCQKAKDLILSIIQPTLVLLSSCCILVAVLCALLVINPFVTTISCIGFGFIYMVVIGVAMDRLDKNSKICATQQARVNKAINEGLGGIRDVLLDGTQPFYVGVYRNALTPMQIANATNQVIGQSPRYGIEALGMVLIAAIAYLLASSSEEGLASSIPVLGALALGAQRLLPVLQGIYSSYVTIKGAKASIQDALDLLEQKLPKYCDNYEYAPILFKQKIAIKNLCFGYSSSGVLVINNINFEIDKGSRIGFIGPTGSGKSTLLDVVMGLLSPGKGEIVVDETILDERNIMLWREHIAHVPQNIFLSDGSVAENIAFGVSLAEIDMQRVKWAAKQAKMDETIQKWPEEYATLVGERGVRLSGGQRQRIGIARALYKKADLIVFDEATSSLDNETEAEVMDAIESLGREITILIIAHRITTLRGCDKIVKIVNGTLGFVGGYEELTG